MAARKRSVPSSTAQELEPRVRIARCMDACPRFPVLPCAGKSRRRLEDNIGMDLKYDVRKLDSTRYSSEAGSCEHGNGPL